MVAPLLACAFGFVWFSAHWFNADLFSPIKLYLLTLFVCFFDIFLNTYRLEICCIYLGLLMVPLALSRYESSVAGRLRAPALCNYRRTGRNASARRTVALIWLLTIVPVACMTYLVTRFGGLSN